MNPLRHLALAPLLALFACGDDATTSPVTPFQSALANETVVNGLDATGRTALCAEVTQWYATQVSVAQTKRLTCYSFALAFTEGSSQACNQFASECLASEEDGDIEVTADVTCDDQRLGDCTATVGELEACFTDGATRLRQVAGAISCSSTASTLSDLDTPITSCETIKAKCPGLFDDEADAEAEAF